MVVACFAVNVGNYVMPLNKLKTLSIGYETGGGAFTESRPTLVMIHGAGCHSQVWKNQTRLLQNAVNTLALDLPGHGSTPGKSMNLVSNYANWLGKVLRLLFEYPVFLMGHSLGGAIVQEIALSHSDIFKGIILAGTGPRLQVAPEFLTGLSDKFEETIDTINKFAYASGADPSMVHEGARLMKEAGSKVVHDDFVACNRFDRRNDLKGLDLPCLVLCGEEDKLTPPVLSRKLNESIKGSTFKILPQAGHLAMIEQYDSFNQIVIDFILPLSKF